MYLSPHCSSLSSEAVFLCGPLEASAQKIGCNHSVGPKSWTWEEMSLPDFFPPVLPVVNHYQDLGSLECFHLLEDKMASSQVYWTVI
jgi:hypothetical protein